ncbi:MAG TPA: ATP-binding protein, partial [Devosia sp.]|nr:ATP-binding protein [Devosia sp.]
QSRSEERDLVITLDDITDLLSAQRTGAWADVARRIAHEIKNPLTPIQLAAERLRRRYAKKLEDDFEVFDKSINTILRQVGDIGRMVDEFSSFARMPEAKPVMGDLTETVRSSVFLESVRLPDLQIRMELPPEPLPAYFDQRLISQVLSNLIKNATEAIEGAGIEATKEPVITVDVHTEGDKARISISDNGKGWPKENRQRLLEPYVTTREKGTGLGLAIVARIIEQHGGSVDLIDAEPDGAGRVGACFTFTLPLHPPHDAAEPSNERAEAGIVPVTPAEGREEPPVLAVEKT